MEKENGCLICAKQRGLSNQPPGGYIYTGEHFAVCHAPLDSGPAGTLLIESTRHILDYAEMRAEELTEHGRWLKQVTRHLKQMTGAERIYHVTMVDGVAHFHTWLVPRRKSDTIRGVRFLALDLACEAEEAGAIVEGMRNLLNAAFHDPGGNQFR